MDKKYVVEIKKNGKVFVMPDTEKEKEGSKPNSDDWQDDILTESDYEKFAKDESNAVISARLHKIEKKLEEMSGANNDEVKIMQRLNNIDYQGNGGVTSMPDNTDGFNGKLLYKKK